MLSNTLRTVIAALGAAVVTAALLTAAPPARAFAADRPVDQLQAEMGPLDAIVEHTPGTADRYDLAGGCFTLYSPAAGAFVGQRGDGSLIADAAQEDSQAFGFQAFDLGKYLLFGAADDVRPTEFLAAEAGAAERIDGGTQETRDALPVREGTDVTRSRDDDAPVSVVVPGIVPPDTWTGAVVLEPEPSPLTEWIIRDADGGFTIHLAADDGFEDDPGPSDVDGAAPVRGTLVAAQDGSLTVAEGEVTDASAVFTPEPATGCDPWPEVDVNVEGELPTGDHLTDETRGYLDAHLHMMAFEFIGGRSRCGRPWHPYGPAYALVDCPDHEPGGRGAALELVLSGAQEHDTVGWPDFSYWPKHNSLTHEQVYYRWMERAWRGGLRTFTNLLVDNNSLCETWVQKGNSCNEMDGVRLQAQRLRELERYIDAQWGGPGEGWFRIVRDPFEARRTIHEGRLAVVMGIEISVLFDCGLYLGVPLCDEDQIDRELAAVHDLGVRQMEFVNKFDNALSGVTGDGGATGLVVNSGNRGDTGQYWQMETCPEDRHEHQHDRQQSNVVDDDPSSQSEQLFGRDAIFGAILQVAGTSGAAPVYPQGPHCNVRGLTDLGRHALDGMVERGMLFDPDHMSTRGREAALDHLQDVHSYSGVISSHSWADDTVYERVLEMGGVVTPYAGGSSGFLDGWRKTRGWADDRYLFGHGYGADTNGFGGQGGPRNPEEDQDVDYPYVGFGGQTFDQQVSGNQVYDINTDGVDHYGLYADWIEDIRVQAEEQRAGDGALFLEEMARGPEAFLQMWERALGVTNDACRDDRVMPATWGNLRKLETGTPYDRVLASLGQPHERSGGVFTYCVRGGTGEVVFDEQGRVTEVRRGERAGPDAGPGAKSEGGAQTDTTVAAPAGAAHDHAVDGHGGVVAALAAVDRPGSGPAVLLLGLALTGGFAGLRRRQ